MPPVLLLLIFVTAFSALALVACLVVTRRSRLAMQRLSAVVAGHTPALPMAPSGVDVRAMLLRAARQLRLHVASFDRAQLTERLSAAGFPTSSAADVYAAARILGPLLGAGLATFLPNTFFWMMALAGALYLLPDIVLQRLVKRRKKRIQLSIPDAIDLLVICVDAGLGLDQAMLRTATELGASHPDLQEELMQVNREQRAGKLRLEAWNSMAKRLQVEEMDAFVNMLMQTERFGTPIARALSNFADGVRLKRRQRAEELAAKTTVKIIFPLVIFIFPSLFIVLLGPAAITIMQGLQSTPK